MNAPRIQSDERGITVNKTLAWLMLGGLLSAGFWLGTEISGTKSAVDNLAATQTRRHNETLAFRSDTESRIRLLETSRASDNSEAQALRRDISGLREDFREFKEIIRDLEQELRRNTQSNPR